MLFFIAFCKVEVMAVCPTTVSNVDGRYFRAETMKLSILMRCYDAKNTTFCIAGCVKKVSLIVVHSSLLMGGCYGSNYPSEQPG